MQKSSVGFVYQINDLILVILRSSQTSYFFIIRKKKLYGGNRKGWRRVSENSIHPLLPFPKKRKHWNEKILFKRVFPERLALNQSFPKSEKKKKSKTKKIPHLNNEVWRKSAKNVVGLGSSACFSVTIHWKSLKNSRNFENSVSLSFSYIRLSNSNRKLQ